MKSQREALQHTPRPFAKALRVGLMLLFVSGCQVVFGDFEFDFSKLAVSCQSGVRRCKDGKIQTCVNGNEWELVADCGSHDLCNLNEPRCGTCQPGAHQCNEAQPEACGVDSKWTATGEPCASAALCQVAGDASTASCVPSGCTAGDKTCCTPGEFRCNDLAATLERCPSDGKTWESVEQCVNKRLCSPQATRCEVPGCTVADATRCQGPEFQICRKDRTGWERSKVCLRTEACDPQSGCLPQLCTEAAFRCNDVDLEQCVQSTWTRVSTCATTALCDAAQHKCTPPACAPGERRCVGAILQRCNGAQTAWDELETCRSKDRCSPETKRCEAN